MQIKTKNRNPKHYFSWFLTMFHYIYVDFYQHHCTIDKVELYLNELIALSLSVFFIFVWFCLSQPMSRYWSEFGIWSSLTWSWFCENNKDFKHLLYFSYLVIVLCVHVQLYYVLNYISQCLKIKYFIWQACVSSKWLQTSALGCPS